MLVLGEWSVGPLGDIPSILSLMTDQVLSKQFPIPNHKIRCVNFGIPLVTYVQLQTSFTKSWVRQLHIVSCSVHVPYPARARSYMWTFWCTEYVCIGISSLLLVWTNYLNKDHPYWRSPCESKCSPSIFLQMHFHSLPVWSLQLGNVPFEWRETYPTPYALTLIWEKCSRGRP